MDVDASGTEKLSFIEGDAGAAGWDKVLTDDGLVSIAQLLRRYHMAVRAFEPPEDSEWASGRVGAGDVDEIILHGDPGPWNVVWDGAKASAFIDWDHANPGDPREDVAYLVAYTAPFCSDEVAMSWMRHSQVPDRCHRLHVVAEAYGVPAEGLVELAANVLAKTNRTVERLASLGLEPQRSWVEAGRLRQFWDRHEWIVAHRHKLAAEC